MKALPASQTVMTHRFHIAAAPPVLGDLDSALSAAGAALNGPSLVEGEEGAVLADPGGALRQIRLGTRIVADNVAVRGVRFVQRLASPGTLRRNGVGPQGMVLESLVVPPTLPMVAVQWSTAGATPGVVVELRLLPEASRVEYHIAEGEVVAFESADPDRLVYLTVSPEAALTATADGQGIRVTIDGTGHGLLTAILAQGTSSRLPTLLAAVPHLAMHERTAVAPSLPGLRLETGMRDLDAGVAWACARLRYSLLRPALEARRDPPGPDLRPEAPADVFWSGIGAMAVGDAASGRRAIAILESQHGEPDADALAIDMAAILAARLALTAGDAGSARSHAERLIRGPTTRLSRLAGVAASYLADGLRHADTEDRIHALRAFRASIAADLRAPLPMLGARAPETPQAAEAALAAWLASAFADSSSHRGLAEPPAGTTDPVAAGLSAWGTTLVDPTAGWSAWRAAVSSGLPSATAGHGAWDSPQRLLRRGAPGAGSLLAALAHGVLGYAPDAPVGRIRLAPRLPPHLTRFAAEGLVVGDATLSFIYERDGDVHAFRLEPTAGRVPPMAVLEPVVAGASVRSVRIDGVAAELNAERVPGGWRVRAQIPVDGPRVLEVETA